MRSFAAFTSSWPGAVMLIAAGWPAWSQDTYPERPIRIIVPTASGGPSDIGARVIGQELTKRWSRQVVVETRPGAGSIVR